MPIKVGANLRRLTQEEFGDIAYRVMGHAFDIHRELGRFFDEEIYQTELAYRCGGARREVSVEVSFDDFRKLYSIDLIVEDGAFFEIKAVDALHDRHRAQLLNYLLLCNVSHGKLVNFGTSAVQHEFVNANLSSSQRTAFHVQGAIWRPPDVPDLGHRMLALLHDVGTGLDVQLYQDALVYWLGGPNLAVRELDVIVAGRRIGGQEMACTPDLAAVEVTALKASELNSFNEQYRRLLNHSTLKGLHWVNVFRDVVTFTTLRPGKE